MLLKKMELKLHKTKEEAKNLRNKISTIMSCVPGNIYWKNRDGVYQGCNEQMAKELALDSPKKIIGKTDYDLMKKKYADQVTKTDQEIMETERSKTLEEIGAFYEKQERTFFTTKAPLYNADGKTTGIIGNSFDITERKQMEASLKKLNEIASQTAHDIRSPLAALNTILEMLPELSEKKRVLIRNATNRINDIANNLLSEYKSSRKPRTEKRLDVELISCLLDSVISEKRTQLLERDIVLHLTIEEEARGAFVQLEAEKFNRMISNLINNAIEAMPSGGNINVALSKENDHIGINIIDDGRGIPASMLSKIKSGGFSMGKKEGFGIGISTASEYIRDWEGSYDLTSRVGKGTIFSIKLPIAKPPLWFQDSLRISPSTHLVVLDDDESIHNIWTMRFEDYISKQKLHISHFYEPATFVAYCEKSLSKEDLFLIDHELIGFEETGLDLIEKKNLSHQALLVTSHDENPDIRERIVMMGAKIIPKNFAPFIKIEINEKSERSKTIQKTFDSVDLVFIDDDRNLTAAWQESSLFSGKKIAVFNHSSTFKKAMSRYKKDTPIYIDSDLGETVKGEIFAKQLYDAGFENLYLATGQEEDSFKDLHWIKQVVGKNPPFMQDVSS